MLYGTAQSPKEWQGLNKENTTDPGEQSGSIPTGICTKLDIQDEPKEADDSSSTGSNDLATMCTTLHSEVQLEDDP